MRTTTIRLPGDLLERIQRDAAAAERPLSRQIVFLLRQQISINDAAKSKAAERVDRLVEANRA